MARFLEFLVAALLVAVLGIAVGAALPSSRTVSHSVETNRPINVAFDMLNGFQRFNDWNTMRIIDPNVKFTLTDAMGVQVDLGLVAWFAPVAVSFLAGLWLERKYLAKPAPKALAAA